MKRMQCDGLIAAITLAVAIPAYAQATGSVWAICSKCHVEQATHPSSMANASSPAAESRLLIARKDLTYQEGDYKYQLRIVGNRVLYTVTDGKKIVDTQIDWAFGSGKMGQAYLFWREGSWYETQVSYYSVLNGLGRMLGGKPAEDFESAIGTRLPENVARGCFSCHTTDYSSDINSNVDSQKLTPGVQCGECHLGAEAHAIHLLAGDQDPTQMNDLSRLDADGVSELCGKCHRTWANIILNGPHGLDNIRFQPYRLSNSKCYNGSDRRISCVACHEPHHELESSSSVYDAKCLACHSRKKTTGISTACPIQTENCIVCHMPKYALPNTHEEFTDHQIRIVRANDRYPN